MRDIIIKSKHRDKPLVVSQLPYFVPPESRFVYFLDYTFKSKKKIIFTGTFQNSFEYSHFLWS